MTRTKFEVIQFNAEGTVVETTVDVSKLVNSDDMYFNATEIAKVFGKRPVDFLRLDDTEKYLNLILNDASNDIKKRDGFNYDFKPHYKIKTRDDLIKVKRGKYGGTWFHQELTLKFARWLSVEFEYNLDKWIKAKLNEEQSRKIARQAAKTGYLPLTKAIEEVHTDPKFYHYSNEANMINRIVLGMDAKAYKEIYKCDDVRDNLSIDELDALDELQAMDATLIKLGMDYDERKVKLVDYYNAKYMRYLN